MKRKLENNGEEAKNIQLAKDEYIGKLEKENLELRVTFFNNFKWIPDNKSLISLIIPQLNQTFKYSLR